MDGLPRDNQDENACCLTQNAPEWTSRVMAIVSEAGFRAPAPIQTGAFFDG